jgi:HrpA-like RNA helicase
MHPPPPPTHTSTHTHTPSHTHAPRRCAGDILLFLTGQAEIDKAVKQLNDAVRGLPPGTCGDLMVLPIYAALPPEMQVGTWGEGGGARSQGTQGGAAAC